MHYEHNKWNLMKISVLLGILMTGVITMAFMHQPKPVSFKSPLTMPGNEIFGTIQEAIHKLEADPHTDWSKVNIEALRQHLLDMKAFTEEVQVINKKSIAHGVEIHVRALTPRAQIALKHVMSMHPKMLKMEKGWDMQATNNGKIWTITCTTKKQKDVKIIRALGYIGLLASGAHHQYHHWLIVTGKMAYP